MRRLLLLAALIAFAAPASASAVTLTSPQSGQSVDDPVFAGTAEPGEVRIVVATPSGTGVADFTATVGGDGAFSAPPPATLEEGEYDVTATQAGSPDAGPLRFRVDRTAPSIALLPGTDGWTYVPYAEVWLGTLPSDADAAQLELAEADGTPVDVIPLSRVPDTSFGLLLDVEDGNYRLTLRQADEAGNVATIQRNVRFDGTPPDLRLDTPADRAEITGTFVELAGRIGTATGGSYSYGDDTPSVYGWIWEREVDIETAHPMRDFAFYPSGDAADFLHRVSLLPNRYTLMACQQDGALPHGWANETCFVRVFTIVAAQRPTRPQPPPVVEEQRPPEMPPLLPPPPPTVEQKLAALLSDARGALALRRLARGRAGRLEFAAPEAGRLTLRVTARRRGATAAARRSRTVVVAKARRTFGAEGTQAVSLRVTRAGRALARRSKRLRATVAATFLPEGGSGVTAKRVLTLRR